MLTNKTLSLRRNFRGKGETFFDKLCKIIKTAWCIIYYVVHTIIKKRFCIKDKEKIIWLRVLDTKIKNIKGF